MSILEAYQNLAVGVIAQAAEDYRRVCNDDAHEHLPEKKRLKILKKKAEILQFFRSAWFTTLSSNSNADYILDRIEAEEEEEKIV